MNFEGDRGLKIRVSVLKQHAGNGRTPKGHSALKTPERLTASHGAPSRGSVRRPRQDSLPGGHQRLGLGDAGESSPIDAHGPEDSFDPSEGTQIFVYRDPVESLPSRSGALVEPGQEGALIADDYGR